MSRAFAKESDEDLAAGEVPERPVSAHPNYVTPYGLELLQSRVRELQEQHEQLSVQADDDPLAKQKLREIERDQRYFNAQLERATVVDPSGQPQDKAHFGAEVEILDEEGKRHRFVIVGDDEADVAGGKISWASPLAKAMIGARVGDTVMWRRPAGDAEVEIVDIRYTKR
ncbi:MAG: transcription elongation factor GreAB [Betaproteobacteria bacterium]|nr:transcription elongation factor GreAB [Betaproteobacteria bacterium]